MRRAQDVVNRNPEVGRDVMNLRIKMDHQGGCVKCDPATVEATLLVNGVADRLTD